MINLTFHLSGDDAWLKTYVLDDGEYSRKGWLHHAMIVCPGGGYAFCSKDEGSLSLFSLPGMATTPLSCIMIVESNILFLLSFSSWQKRSASSKTICRNGASTESISLVCAGANLALSLGCFFDRKDLLKEFYPGNNSLTPSHILLGYPAITLHPIHPKEDLPQAVIDLIEAGKMPDFRGPTIREILLGKENPFEKELESLNLLQYLRHDLPPIFAFGSYQDTIIQASDLTELARRLVELHVPFELHLFADGPHGASLCDETVKSKDEIDELNMRYWTTLALGFLEHN